MTSDQCDFLRESQDLQESTRFASKQFTADILTWGNAGNEVEIQQIITCYHLLKLSVKQDLSTNFSLTF